MQYKAIIDIETDSIKNGEVSQIWCINIRDITTNKSQTFVNREKFFGMKKSWKYFEDIPEHIANIDVLIGHNLIGFDVKVMNEILGFNFKRLVLVDTMLLANQMFSSSVMAEFDRNRIGHLEDKPYKIMSNSLEAWSHRLSNGEKSGLKGFFNNYDLVTDDEFDSKHIYKCVDYMEQDTKVTLNLYKFLLKNDKFPSQKALYRESRMAQIAIDIQAHGIYIDEVKSMKLRIKLNNEIMMRSDAVQEHMPKVVKTFKPKSTKREVVCKKGWKDDAISKREYDEANTFSNLYPFYFPYPLTKTGNIKWTGLSKLAFFTELHRFVKVHWVFETSEPNMGSTKQLGSYLESIGWNHRAYTAKGSPKTDIRSLRGLKLGSELFPLLKAKKASSMLKSIEDKWTHSTWEVRQLEHKAIKKQDAQTANLDDIESPDWF